MIETGIMGLPALALPRTRGGSFIWRSKDDFHVLSGLRVHEQIHRLQIPADLWRTVAFALRDRGWRLDMGGGLDHSWAVLERNGMRIEMDYDIWSEGEIVIDAADIAKIAADLPGDLTRRLGLS